MPIYAYKCERCGHAADVLQKISDAPLTECPECGASAFKKQLTAAGFQLKGSGWYATDFRNNGGGGKKPDAAADAKSDGGEGKAAEPAGDKQAGEKKGSDKPSGDKGDSTSTPAGQAPAAKPAAGPAAPSTGGAAAG